MITKADWRGSGTIKRWVTQPEDVERILSIPYVTLRPDLTGFFETKKRLEGKCVVQVTFADPICIAGMVDVAISILQLLIAYREKKESRLSKEVTELK